MVRSEGVTTWPASGSSRRARIFSSVVLPAPFGPHRPDAVARVQLPGDVVEQHTIGKGLAESYQLQHAGDRSRTAMDA